MAIWKNEEEARLHIKNLVAQYYHDFKENKKEYVEGERITYAARVFDENEMCALTDATLDFWLTTGRFADEFEREFAKWSKYWDFWIRKISFRQLLYRFFFYRSSLFKKISSRTCFRRKKLM